MGTELGADMVTGGSHPGVEGVQGWAGPVSMIWPHREGLTWPHLRHAGSLL